jgi:hypothetical protein
LIIELLPRASTSTRMHQEQLDQVAPGSEGSAWVLYRNLTASRMPGTEPRRKYQQYATNTGVLNTDLGLGQALLGWNQTLAMQTEGVDRPVDPMRW